MQTAAVRFDVTLAAGTDGVVVEVCPRPRVHDVGGPLHRDGRERDAHGHAPRGSLLLARLRADRYRRGHRRLDAHVVVHAAQRAAGVVGVERVLPDVNGDGVADLVVGAPYTWSALYYQGASPSASTLPTQTLEGPVESSFGELLGVGDFNGDGLGDLVAGFTFDNRVIVHAGIGSGFSTTGTTISPTSSRVFGSVVSPSPDLDGDGFNDLLVSACNFEVCEGTIYLVRGGATGLSSSPTVISAPTAATRFGLDVVSLGQTDSDPSPEVVVVGGGGTSGASSTSTGRRPSRARGRTRPSARSASRPRASASPTARGSRRPT
ncbi:MAG: VCBS repeat-containing protein [Polyangiales bacterium]